MRTRSAYAHKKGTFYYYRACFLAPRQSSFHSHRPSILGCARIVTCADPYRPTAPIPTIDGKWCGIYINQKRWLVPKLHPTISAGVQGLSWIQLEPYLPRHTPWQPTPPWQATYCTYCRIAAYLRRGSPNFEARSATLVPQRQMVLGRRPDLFQALLRSEAGSRCRIMSYISR